MSAVNVYFVESKLLSVFIKTDENTIKEITLIKDKNDLKKKLKESVSPLDKLPLKELIHRFREYLSGEKVAFEFECDFSGYTDLEKRILKEVKKIPYGETLSYEEVAEKVCNKNLRRAVGRTVKKNRFPIVIPCHRVIGKGGKMTGFSADGGIALKEKLINMEKQTLY
jgi:methylated-DNA-[protein]-cysteine S-methyltransferase